MAESQDSILPQLISDYESKRSNLTVDEIRQMIRQRWDVMKEAVHVGLTSDIKLIGGITSGTDAKSLFKAYKEGRLVAGKILSLASARAVATAEVNGERWVEIGCSAHSWRLWGDTRPPDDLGRRTTFNGGADCRCAAVQLADGTPKQVINAMSFALKNILGLVCDTVAGSVEVPCIKRNIIGVANALSAADLALARIQSVIPPDEVVDALRNVQELMPVELRDTMLGGLGATCTGKRLKEQWLEKGSN